MTNNLLMDFQVDKENNSLIIKREFAAPLDIVWDAYTRSEWLDKWWAPKPWKTRTKSQDFRPGGQWIYAMVGPEGEEHWCINNYQTINPKKSFTGVDAFSDEEGNINTEFPSAQWENNFSKQSDNLTLVTIHVSYESLKDLETILQMGMKEGLTMAMTNLDALLEERKG